MELWNDFLSWINTTDSERMIGNVIIPFVAILIAGILAAMIGRGSTTRIIARNDRENRVSAVATMIGAARRASVWNTLSVPEQQHADHVASEADVRVRLLAVPGSSLAADWAAHEIASMKRDSVSFSFQAEQSLIELRDRLVTWQGKPGRAKKLFKNDLDLWSYEDTKNGTDLVSQQQAWAAAKVASETDQVVTADPALEAAAARPAAPAETSATEQHPQAPRDAEATPAPDAPVRPSHEDASDDEDVRENKVHYSPVTANTVTKRVNPPLVGEDGVRY